MKEKIMGSSDGNFILYRVEGVGRNDTPYSDLEVVSEGLADKHVIEIRLESTMPRFEGKPVQYKYYGSYISHGMRMNSDTLAETEEYIKVLQEAVDFAHQVNQYIDQNDEWKAD